MQRFEGTLNTNGENKYWIWPENHEAFKTSQESVFGVNVTIQKDNKLSTDASTVFMLNDHQTWCNLADTCKMQIKKKSS